MLTSTPSPVPSKPHIITAYTESKQEGVVFLLVQCKFCSDLNLIKTTRNACVRWVNSDGFIQNLMPELTDDERELLISGTCGTCFDKFTAANNIVGDYFDKGF